MKWFFFPVCLGLIFTVGCNLSLDGNGGSGDSSGDVATRSAYSTIESWDGQVAKLTDGYNIIVVDGTFQRDSCSWQDTPTDEFLNNVGKGQLAYYRVAIGDDFVPGEPIIATQFTVVNLDCFRSDPCTCGCEEGVQ
jgi:hypothetical protein